MSTNVSLHLPNSKPCLRTGGLLHGGETRTQPGGMYRRGLSELSRRCIKSSDHASNALKQTPLWISNSTPNIPLPVALMQHLETPLVFLPTILCLKDLVPDQRHGRKAAIQLAFGLVQGIQ